jgi:hypothetical protein
MFASCAYLLDGFVIYVHLYSVSCYSLRINYLVQCAKEHLVNLLNCNKTVAETQASGLTVNRLQYSSVLRLHTSVM